MKNQNNYELDVTRFFAYENAKDFSASVAEIGENACAITWRAALDAAAFYNILDNDEKIENFERYIKGFGAWDDSEIQAMDLFELNALLIQMIAGDIREGGLDQSPIDWDTYRVRAEAGQCSGRIYLAGDHVYYSIAE